MPDICTRRRVILTCYRAHNPDFRQWLENELTSWIDHDEIPEQLNDLRLLVLPSQPIERFPTVILESMGCRTPVCSELVSGVSEVVREDEAGFHLAVATSVSGIFNRPSRTTDINCTETVNLLKTARTKNFDRLVIASFAAIYCSVVSVSVAETATPNLESPYELSKR